MTKGNFDQADFRKTLGQFATGRYGCHDFGLGKGTGRHNLQ